LAERKDLEEKLEKLRHETRKKPDHKVAEKEKKEEGQKRRPKKTKKTRIQRRIREKTPTQNRTPRRREAGRPGSKGPTGRGG